MLQCAARVSKLLRWHLKSCLCRGEKLRERERFKLLREAVNYRRVKRSWQVVEMKTKDPARKLTINTCIKRIAK